jgi:hypothetical protein
VSVSGFGIRHGRARAQSAMPARVCTGCRTRGRSCRRRRGGLAVSSPGPPGFLPTRCNGIGPGFKAPDRRLSLFSGFLPGAEAGGRRRDRGEGLIRDCCSRSVYGVVRGPAQALRAGAGLTQEELAKAAGAVRHPGCGRADAAAGCRLLTGRDSELRQLLRAAADAAGLRAVPARHPRCVVGR